MEQDERILRQLLWLRHGCPIHALYGDDGEMQCGQCLIDFKRNTAEQIEARFSLLAMKRYEEERGGKLGVENE